MISAERIRETIESILAETIGIDVRSQKDADLIESGLLDSLGFVVLCVHLDEKLGIKFDVERLEVDHLRTPHGLAAFIAEHQSGVEGFSAA